MNSTGEVADLMVKEGMLVTEETIKLLAAGSKNLAALLIALAKSEKKLSGKSSMRRLMGEGKALKVFQIRESDLEDFRRYAKKNILYSVIKDKRGSGGTVDLITSTDYIAQVNLFMERHGYGVPQGEAPKKGVPRAPQDSSLIQRGSGWKTPNTRTRTTADKPSVRGRLDALRAASKNMGRSREPQRSKPTPKKQR